MIYKCLLSRQVLQQTNREPEHENLPLIKLSIPFILPHLYYSMLLLDSYLRNKRIKDLQVAFHRGLKKSAKTRHTLNA